jgi:hypothetical protein
MAYRDRELETKGTLPLTETADEHRLPLEHTNIPVEITEYSEGGMSIIWGKLAILQPNFYV